MASLTQHTDRIQPKANRIELFRRNGCWLAQWIGPHAASVERAFGTTIIPTGFADHAPADKVRATIRGLNHNCVVCVGNWWTGRHPTDR